MPERAKATPAEPARAPAQAQPAQGGMQPSAEIAGDADMERALASGQAVATAQAASGAADPPESFRMTANGMLALQRKVGNRAVAAAMQSVVQRVPVKVSGGETIYNQSAAGGQAGAKHYGMGGQYDMTRDGDAGATVTIKIKFVRQTRNTMPPTPPATTPKVGDLTGPQTVLPAGDQAWATATAASAVAHWNGRLTLVGEEWNAFKANTKKRLPVTFKAVPTFGLNDPADQVVVVHPPGVLGGSTGNPIDAGNYYMKKDDSAYPAAADIIYAHEYGHLLGIPDEYSQNNEQMNQLLHRSAPAGKAASNMAALDKKTVERMTLAALARPMYAQLQSTMAAVANAIRGQRRAVKQKMALAARDGARSAEVRDQLKAQLGTASEAALNPKIPGVVAFETTKNFSNVEFANQGVEAGFATAALTKQIGDLYWAALNKPQGEKVSLPSFGDVKINVASSVYGTTGGGTLQAPAAAEAQGVVGQTGPGLPAMPPPTTLTGQLAGVPPTWGNAAGAIATGITPAAFSAKMLAALQAAAVAEAAPPPPGAAPAPKLANARSLYNKALTLVTNAAKTASQQLAADLVQSTLDPVLAASVSSLQTAIGTEVTRIMTMSPAQLAANPSPDPNMAAVVTGMKTRLDAAKTALSGTGMDPLGVSGGTAPAQDVTYSYQGLMGSNASADLRADQFQGLADNFNKKLASIWEKKFVPEVK
jgi:hypothetical protein